MLVKHLFICSKRSSLNNFLWWLVDVAGSGRPAMVKNLPKVVWAKSAVKFGQDGYWTFLIQKICLKVFLCQCGCHIYCMLILMKSEKNPYIWLAIPLLTNNDHNEDNANVEKDWKLLEHPMIINYEMLIIVGLIKLKKQKNLRI